MVVNRHLVEMQSSVEKRSQPSPASRRDAAFVRITDVMRGAVRSNVSTELQSLTGLLLAGYLLCFAGKNKVGNKVYILIHDAEKTCSHPYLVT